MRKMTKKNKIAAVAASVALVAVGGGAAYAYWSTTGSGSGSAAAASGTNPVTINVTVDPGVVPGGPAKTITYTADNSANTSSTPVTLTNPVVSTTAAGCDAAWFTATVPAGTTTVLGGATSTALGTGTLTFNDDSAVNQDGCKNATITVSVSSK
ncbi:hypothetical protein JOE40_000774 [Arthrobacter sp. PvP102]|uniref:hypothetical protein n=1 Tax=unclassified Arthrobacter TaxID=235627 RepID=UPI001AE18257|nr:MULTISPECIES: hypothetical protein [unclassified Arthrobacter]MBP1235306.1 hypothetical protein [Arthrobacter sp. PvP103]MBP1236265.1 hypothetical protein [Arthrobacter sp. PvP102]